MKSALLRTPLILNKFAFLTSSISKSVMTWSFKKIRLPLWVRLSHYSELWVPVLYTFLDMGPEIGKNDIYFTEYVSRESNIFNFYDAVILKHIGFIGILLH